MRYTMIEEFLDGKYAVFLDKTKPKLIGKFYNFIYGRIKGFTYPFGFTMLDYFKSKASGPYFFVEKHGRRINGSSLEWVVNNGFEICYPEDFFEEATSININENDYLNIFK